MSFASIIAGGLTSAAASEAQKAGAGGVAVTVLERRPLTDARGKEVTIATIDYAPGAAVFHDRRYDNIFDTIPTIGESWSTQ